MAGYGGLGASVLIGRLDGPRESRPERIVVRHVALSNDEAQGDDKGDEYPQGAKKLASGDGGPQRLAVRGLRRFRRRKRVEAHVGSTPRGLSFRAKPKNYDQDPLTLG
jgi:hypothetical protein